MGREEGIAQAMWFDSQRLMRIGPQCEGVTVLEPLRGGA